MIQAVTPYILQNLIWPPTRFFLKFFGHLEIKGLENLRGINNGVIFASNHTSELDPILIPASLPWFSNLSPMFYVSREKSFYNPTILKRIFYGGFFFELWGAHPAKAGFNNYHLALENHLEILRRGYSLSIFPEGDKSLDGKLKEGKGGAVYLSHQTGVPIVPVGVNGVLGINLLSFFSRKKKIILSFGKPMYPNDLISGKGVKNPHEYKQITQRVMEEIEKELKKQ